MMKLLDLFLCLLFVSFIHCEFWESWENLEDNDNSEEDNSSEDIKKKPVVNIKPKENYLSEEKDISEENDSSEEKLKKPINGIKNENDKESDSLVATEQKQVNSALKRKNSENEIYEEKNSSEEKHPLVDGVKGKAEDSIDEHFLPLLKECRDSCLFEAAKKTIIDNIYKTSVGKNCMEGCKKQHIALLDFKKINPNTSPDLLLGAALDNCWDGCSALTDGEVFCNSGCDKMRNIQRKLLKTGEIQYREKVEKKEDKKDSFNNENVENNIEKVQGLQGVDDDGNTWTYYLLNPSEQGSIGSLLTYISMMNMMDNMFWDVDTRLDEQCKGWKDDRRQLNFPQYPARTAALTDNNEYYSNLYDKVSSSLSQIRKKVQDTVSTPGFNEYLFYILFWVCGIMLLQSVLDILLGNKDPKQTVDHFYLPPAGPLPPKLPSYDECMKDSQKLCVGLTQQEDICKINPSLPVVSLPLANVTEKENAMEDVDLAEDNIGEKA